MVNCFNKSDFCQKSDFFNTRFEAILYLFREWSEADFPKLLCYLGFGKSYLIPETTDFDIGDGINIQSL